MGPTLVRPTSMYMFWMCDTVFGTGSRPALNEHVMARGLTARLLWLGPGIGGCRQALRGR